MQTDCIFAQLEFKGFDGHKVVAGFDGGAITSDAGALLLRHVDAAIGLFDRVAACFVDGRDRKCTVPRARWSGSALRRSRWATRMSMITTRCATTRCLRCCQSD